MSALGRAIGIAVFLLLAFLAIGVWLDWFEFDTSRDRAGDGEEYGFRVRVDEEKIEDDKRRVQEMIEREGDEDGTRTVEGRVASIDRRNGTATVRIETADGDLAIRADENTRIRGADGDEIDALGRLEEGERVEVHFVVEDGERIAKEIRIVGTGRP